MSIEKELRAFASAHRKKRNESFFKMRKGEYGYGDRFLGVASPDVRKVVRGYVDISFAEVGKILRSPLHEVRLAGLLVLVEKYKRGDVSQKKKVYAYMLRHMSAMNNWDLVDVIVPHIIGEHVLVHNGERKRLLVLVKDRNMWKRRVAVLGCFPMVRRGEFTVPLTVARLVLDDTEDLMHKALGWMLREVGKVDMAVLKKFLIAEYDRLPRTALRYAIERMPERERKKFLRGF